MLGVGVTAVWIARTDRMSLTTSAVMGEQLLVKNGSLLVMMKNALTLVLFVMANLIVVTVQTKMIVIRLFLFTPRRNPSRQPGLRPQRHGDDPNVARTSINVSMVDVSRSANGVMVARIVPMKKMKILTTARNVRKNQRVRLTVG